MARGTRFKELIDKFRAEASLSSDRSSGQNHVTSIRLLLARTQEFLYADHDWPFAMTRKVVEISDGQRDYALPDEIPFDNITFVGVLQATDWCPLTYGITDKQLAEYENDTFLQTWPPTNWQASPTGFEIHNTPDRNGKLLFRGKIKLPQLVDEDEDRAFLDDNLIAMFAAVEWLAEKHPRRAQKKQDLAQQLYAKLKSRQTAGKTSTTAVSVSAPPTRLRRGLDYMDS